MLNKLKDCPGFSLDVETTSESGKKKDNLHFKRCKIVRIGFAYNDINFSLSAQEIDWKLLDELLQTKLLVGHNLKYDLKVISNHTKQEYKSWFDTYIASMLINENGDHDLKSLAKKHLGVEWGHWDADMTDEQLAEYNKLDALYTFQLAEKFKIQLERQQLLELFSTEMEVQNVFYRAELAGVPIDNSFLTDLARRYNRHVERIEKLIFKLAGKEFNINSSQQLADVLYVSMNVPVLRQTDKGKASTDVKTLKNLARLGHRFADYLLAYRHWEMLNRHIEKLLKEQIDGRIFPTFNTIGTETGRFSCASPNLQQIPSKTRESRQIRKGFTGPLLVFDYSNIELRLLAHYTRDPRLLSVYLPGGNEDLHALTAESLKISRSHAKTINFGISYGMGPKKLAEDLNIDSLLADQYINNWYRTYKCVQPWKDMIVATAKKYGYIRSIGSRKRRIMELSSPDKWTRISAEREVVNYVIQGSSADITKKAIYALRDEDIRMQVHDEIVIYNPKRSIEEIKRIAENVVKLRVPLKVDIKLCDRWSDMKD